MADTVSADNPNLQQQIARMIAGDAKPGSIRAHLAQAIAGGQVAGGAGSEGMPLLGFTPAAPVLAADAMKKASGPAGMLSAAAGMVGPEGEGIGKFLGSAIERIGPHSVIEGIGPNGGRFMVKSPSETAVYNNKEDALQHMRLNARETGHDVSGDEPSEVNQLKNAVVQRKGSGNTPVQTPAAQADAARADKGAVAEGDLTPEEHATIDKLAGGDASKSNFIKNAMMDEGGNVPEEVADTLVQHSRGKPEYDDMVAKYEAYDDDVANEEYKLADALVQNHSIPEMLAMHYDLNPTLMGKAYEMPAPKKGGSKPTQ